MELYSLGRLLLLLKDQSLLKLELELKVDPIAVTDYQIYPCSLTHSLRSIVALASPSIQI
jgi:hypothetical protein